MKTKNNNNLPSCVLAFALLLGCMLARADIPPGYSVLETITYEYDAEGNRVTRGATVSSVAETPIEAQYDQGNRLTQLTLKGQGQSNADTTCMLAYDLSGNLATKTCTNGGGTTAIVTQYTWDSRSRLIHIQSPSLTADFQYDPLGRRIERTVNGVTTHYLYDGSQAIAELSDTGNNASYLTGLAIDEVIARYTNQGERTLLTDALGSVLIAAKEDTTVATAYGYSSYGETQIMGTDEQNPIQYTSRENDGTELYYYRARYYDPELKRFISEDPIGINGGINVYAYVNGNPLSKADPYGLFAGDPSDYAAATVIATATGVAVSTVVAIGAGVIAGVYPNSAGEGSDKPPKECRACPPCTPYPVGTSGYQGPKVSQQGIDKGVPHYILFEVQQIPSSCQCIWKENTKGIAGGHHAYAPVGVNLNGLPRPPPYPGR